MIIEKKFIAEGPKAEKTHVNSKFNFRSINKAIIYNLLYCSYSDHLKLSSGIKKPACRCWLKR